MIKVEQLIYTYPGSEDPVLKDISFEIGKGEIFGFLGPSGAGKSTTQKVLNGILKHFKGSVFVNGNDLSRINRSFYEKIGVAFEFPNLYTKLTALENLKLYASFYNTVTADPEYLLDLVGLTDDKNIRVEAYSKGMKMRLNFIRSILNNPEILFLDEPTAGLDPVNARRMKDIILDLQNKGTTIFLTTHNMSDADELCGRLAFIVEGQLPVIDTTHALKLKHGKKVIKVEFRINGSTHIEEFELKDLSENQRFQSILATEEIETIHTQEATLESIFIKVTGKKLT
ncbi:ABC transporter ATP-binding protein [Bacteroidota bacterium]